MEPKVTALHDAEMRELLGAFALGAVDAQEAAAVRAFLAQDAAAREELAELMAGVDALSLAPAPLDPPPALRERISSAVLDDVGEPPAPVTAPAAPPVPIIAPEPIGRPASFWSRATPWAAAAAALLLIAAGLLIWNLQLREQLAQTPVTDVVALAPSDLAPDASGEVHYTPAQQLFLIDVRDLPPLAEGQVYEVWLIGDGEPVPAGTFDQSTAQHAFVADRAEFDTLAITAEPGPLGTMLPTGEVVATASI